MIDIEKLKQAALAATQGEWIANANGAVRTVAGDESTRGRARWQGPFRQVDADFIATSNPSAVLELIARLDAAEQDALRFRWLAGTTSEDCSYNETHANWPSGRLADCVDAAMKENK